MSKIFVVLAIFLANLAAFNCVYFQVHDTRQKCLIEDLPKHEVVLVQYNVMDGYAPLTIKVTDDKQKELISQVLPNGKGKLSFTTQEQGVVRVCISAAPGDWQRDRKKIRYSLRLHIGEGMRNYDDLANKEHLSNLQIMVLRFYDRTLDFLKMQDMNREQEALQVEQNENINERVITTTIIQTIIILLSGLFQIWSLRKFFIQKKIF